MTTHRLHFQYTLDAYAEATQLGDKWVGTVNESDIRPGEKPICVESDSADGALRAANAAFVYRAAERIGRGEQL